SLGPSHETPPNGLRNVSALIAALYPVPLTPSKLNDPSSALVVVANVPPLGSFSATLTPGIPSSPGSTFPGTPPPGLKYLQTTPAAKSEIAIGMKTAVLNATAQLIRSVSTAKTRPIAVMSAGTTSTQ